MVEPREARLLAPLLNVLVAGLCDSSRLQRGRTYHRQGAVLDVVTEVGELTGYVQGSHREAYRVVVNVAPGRSTSPASELVPTAREILFHCSCPDATSPCKHAVAVMCAFAERVSAAPDLLITWRGLDSAAAPRVRAGARAGTGGTAAPAGPRLAPEVLAAIGTWLGERPAGHADDDERDDAPSWSELLAAIPRAGAPHADAWDEPWAAMLVDAIDTLTSEP